MKNLAHSASFHSAEKTAPSKPGIKHLDDARENPLNARRTLAAGHDPIQRRRSLKEASDNAETFGPFADALLTNIGAGFRNAKHRAQWKSTLGTYAKSLRNNRLDQISTNDVLDVLKPIWMTKPETASRLRGRIEHVLDAAKAKGLRTGENPAIWQGNLAMLLSKPKKLSRGHHSAMSYDDLPSFIADLRKRDGVAALALEFTILTATRSGEVFGAKRSEIDLKARVWTIPADRMKNGKQHRVPLCDRAVEIIETSASLSSSGQVLDSPLFEGQRPGRPLSNMAMAMVLGRMNRGDVTVHGFRSTFRDWAGNETNRAREIAEAALSHAVGDRAEQAYRRGDALKKRSLLMQAWADHCEGGVKEENVIPFTRSA